VILDKNDLPSDTNCLLKENHRIGSVMEHINKQHNIEAACAVWHRPAIECLYGGSQHLRAGERPFLRPEHLTVIDASRLLATDYS
jgi:hypothetical protein